MAGPVTAAALILPRDFENAILNDSKLLSEKKRSALRPIIENRALCFGIAHIFPEEIDKINKRVYSDINNGVYKAGFATKQTAYAENVNNLFEALDWVENILGTNRYLVGDQITEADWRLFTTLVRFDAVYVGHFKCNLKRIVDYPNIYRYMRELYQIEGVAETVNMRHIKHHYYLSHPTINPTGIVPVGPTLDFAAPYDHD